MSREGYGDTAVDNAALPGAAGPERLMGHEEFLQRYVLNRALAHVGGLDGVGCARQAESAWNGIRKIIGEGGN